VKWVTYLVKDTTGTVQSRIRAPEGEALQLPPSILRNVVDKGWLVEKWSTNETGVEVHGIVDWKRHADQMAGVLQMLVSGSEPDPEVRMEYVQSALYDYRIAEMEASMVEAPVAVEEPTEEPTEPEGDSDEG
jgi:hypothetical protein